MRTCQPMFTDFPCKRQTRPVLRSTGGLVTQRHGPGTRRGLSRSHREGGTVGLALPVSHLQGASQPIGVKSRGRLCFSRFPCVCVSLMQG